ncbi:MAG: hypothetical protein Q9183_003014 [Haloplaca sp. 2 TL-2023]
MTRSRSPSEATGTGQQSGTTSHIDLVLVSHEFTDHCNFFTLRQLPVDTPVLATKKAAHLIQSFKHFDTVYPMKLFSQLNYDWRNTSSEAMPSWLGISRITTNKDALYFHSAILITFNIGPSPEDRLGEAIVYTPHGINADDLKMLAMASPRINTLALLHGLHDIKLSVRQLNLGAHNALRAQRISGSKYWISTHDEIKKAGGLVRWFLKRKIWTIEDVLQKEKKETGGIAVEDPLTTLRDVHFANLDSGECLLLV